MAPQRTNIIDEIAIAAGNLAHSASGLVTPTLRLGVTGLSRAGKTVFITALISNLIKHDRMSGFAPVAEGRFLGANLIEHPDPNIPRFAVEQHMRALRDEPAQWPQSTRKISNIRLELRFQSKNWINNLTGPSTLFLDIVDYPGEWLLDLPLLDLSFAEWSEKSLAEITADHANPSTAAYASELLKISSENPADEDHAEQLTLAFKQHLRPGGDESAATAQKLATLPPGRFLMPGDLEGAPSLTFAPLPASAQSSDRNSLYALMSRRFEAYKSEIVRPFFRDHFARLDRQIVLVDALKALNHGPEAITDLSEALTSVLSAFRQGANSPLNWLIARRIDKILFAATKADHVHHTSHDRLAAILNKLVERAAQRAQFSGAMTKTLAIAGVRATKEGLIKENGEDLPCLIGTPQAGEKIGDDLYDGTEEIALFPGDLPEKADSVFEPSFKVGQLNFLRFNPPPPDQNGNLAHIRIDQATNFLLEDWMK